ncbi:RNA polymerase sigma factor [Arsenicibacter rosenii]|uniref:RNA polymerase subunit sigma-24 n=1 Tax=Arsenicibacter rosenii TaxID=1750698 RepID=A0A1S2VEM8_9BACT|nr:RNA polymerase sigma factor [Arsenicibacter rosenii]OIN57162.1 RNA polymerase subunit sigma-24 [Arsenicibacter rosenii]
MSVNQLSNTADESGQPDLRETVRRERPRLLDFIRRRLPDPDDAEDLLQDVFYELTLAYQLTKPVERVASWLFAVARNKINDWYRKPKMQSLDAPASGDDDDEAPVLGEWLAIADDNGDDGGLLRESLMDAIADALEELPDEQREVFVRHEIEGQSFRQISEALGVSQNTLLSRKHYAVRSLRERLQTYYEDLLD